ncbi:CobW family GTP-binding protein [Thermus altitudinis]|uniref:CobW family GTP-binding protein n=1 Tax=Thermus altitudinis TaxID=2908145 RepID=UPI001FAB0435|nr:GTP-binding protein [Thermus altitudinis]
MDERRPVTLITGFLGSGKTTLVNRLLEQREDLFVLVNEFGEVALDDALVGGRAEALAEGCLCCGLQEELVAALAALARKGGFPHLLLETTGLAHPAPILQVILAPGVREAYRLAGVVAVVDPLNLGAYRGFPEALAQVRYADLVFLSKADRAEEEELEEATRWVRSLNPVAPVVPTVRGQGLAVEEVLFPRQAQGFRILSPLPQALHKEGVEAVALAAPGAVAYEDFRALLEEAVLAKGVFRKGRLLRAKGEVNLRGSSRSLRFHLVFGLLDFEKGPPWPPGPRLNCLVFIGEGLDGPAIRERVQALVGD